MMAKYSRHGRVRVVTCTGGERGDILNPALEGDETILANLPEVRKAEMAKAVEALGVEHTWLGFVDSGLPEGDPIPELDECCFACTDISEPVRRLVAQIREFRPQVLTTYNELGGYPHPDHIRTHTISLAAVAAAGDPYYAPELGDAWIVSKVYYDVGFSEARYRAIADAMEEAGLENPFTGWLDHHADAPEPEVTASIQVADYFPQRDAALRAHATQIDPNGFFFAAPRDLEAKVWPWEQYRLALSTVGWPKKMETDLFERVPDVEIVD